MAGAVFVALLITWFYLAHRIARKLVSRVQSKQLRFLLMGFLVAGFSALLVIDEIIGGFQFRAICKKKAVLKIDEQKIKGKTIAVVVNPSHQDISGAAISISHSRFGYFDTGTGEELASYSRIEAEGGKLVWLLAGGHPMPPLIPLSKTGNVCSLSDRSDLSKKYEFTYQPILGK